MKIRKRLYIILLKSSNGPRTPLLNNTMTQTINHQMLLSHPIIRRQLHCWCRWWPTPLNFALWLQLASTWPWPENMQSVAKLPECVSYPFSEMKWKKKAPKFTWRMLRKRQENTFFCWTMLNVDVSMKKILQKESLPIVMMIIKKNVESCSKKRKEKKYFRKKQVWWC